MIIYTPTGKVIYETSIEHFIYEKEWWVACKYHTDFGPKLLVHVQILIILKYRFRLQKETKKIEI